MPNQVKNAMFLTVALALFGSASFGVTPAAAQARTTEGKPDFSGIWQANTTANWDLQTHGARPMVAQPGVYPNVPVLGPQSWHSERWAGCHLVWESSRATRFPINPGRLSEGART